VRERAIVVEVSKALNPGQQVIKIVNEELIATLGRRTRSTFRRKAAHIDAGGFAGIGQDNCCREVSQLPAGPWERVMLVAGDPYRPAAVEQLRTLGQQVDVPVFFEANVKPPELAKHAFEKARNVVITVVIMDTGRAFPVG